MSLYLRERASPKQIEDLRGERLDLGILRSHIRPNLPINLGFSDLTFSAGASRLTAHTWARPLEPRVPSQRPSWLLQRKSDPMVNWLLNYFETVGVRGKIKPRNKRGLPGRFSAPRIVAGGANTLPQSGVE